MVRPSCTQKCLLWSLSVLAVVSGYGTHALCNAQNHQRVLRQKCPSYTVCSVLSSDGFAPFVQVTMSLGLMMQSHKGRRSAVQQGPPVCSAIMWVHFRQLQTDAYSETIGAPRPDAGVTLCRLAARFALCRVQCRIPPVHDSPAACKGCPALEADSPT